MLRDGWISGTAIGEDLLKRNSDEWNRMRRSERMRISLAERVGVAGVACGYG